MAVPVIGLTVGWRWAFAAGALVAVAVVLIAPGSTRPSGIRNVHRAIPSVAVPAMRKRRYLLVFAAAAVFGTAAASAMAAFYGPSAVGHGHSAAAAGSWLAAGGLFGVLGRMFWGWLADRRAGRHFIKVSMLMMTGAAGYFMLGAADS